MHPQVLLHQLGERHLTTGSQPLELSPKRSFGCGASRQSAYLRPLRAAAVDAVAVRPYRFPVTATRPEIQDLTMLCHLGHLPRIDNEPKVDDGR
jgi:hypothetical protein